MYYKQIGKDTEVPAVYEEAWNQDPSNFRLGEEAFLAYVSASMHSFAQRTATRLQAKRKVHGSKQAYVLWSIVATHLQVSKRNVLGKRTCHRP